jgi:hypothetical protein
MEAEQSREGEEPLHHVARVWARVVEVTSSTLTPDCCLFSRTFVISINLRSVVQFRESYVSESSLLLIFDFTVSQVFNSSGKV